MIADLSLVKNYLTGSATCQSRNKIYLKKILPRLKHCVDVARLPMLYCNSVLQDHLAFYKGLERGYHGWEFYKN